MSMKNNEIAKFMQVKRIIREKIAKGEYSVGSPLPPYSKLPKLLGYSKSTVLRALDDLVDEGLLYRRRGSGTYVSDSNSKEISKRKTSRLGILNRTTVSPSWFMNDYAGRIAKGIIENCGLDAMNPKFPLVEAKEDSCAIWQNSSKDFTVECLGEPSFSQERHPSLEIVRTRSFDGLIIIGITDEDWIEEIIGLGVPVILVDILSERFNNQVDQIFVDPLFGYGAATTFFTDQKIKKIHFVGSKIGGPVVSSTLKQNMSDADWRKLYEKNLRVNPDSYLRLNAFRQAMEGAGLGFKEEWVHFESSNLEHMFKLAEKLRRLPKRERPDAVICHDLQQAQVLIDHFAKHKLKLVGAGASSEEHEGKAHRIFVDLEKLGGISAETLLSRLLRSGGYPTNIGVSMEFDSQYSEKKILV